VAAGRAGRLSRLPAGAVRTFETRSRCAWYWQRNTAAWGLSGQGGGLHRAGQGNCWRTTAIANHGFPIVPVDAGAVLKAVVLNLQSVWTDTPAEKESKRLLCSGSSSSHSGMLRPCSVDLPGSGLPMNLRGCGPLQKFSGSAAREPRTRQTAGADCSERLQSTAASLIISRRTNAAVGYGSAYRWRPAASPGPCRQSAPLLLFLLAADLLEAAEELLDSLQRH